MVGSKNVMTPAEAVEFCRQVGSEPPEWLLQQAGLAPKPREVPDESFEDAEEEDYGWRRYHKGWGNRR